MFQVEALRSRSLAAGPALQTYLLGPIEFEEALVLQRRLVYEVAGGATPALLLCEHPRLVTVGRHGSHTHLHLDETEFHYHRPRVRWVNRGGGCWLHLPGQLAIYPILPLRRMDLSLRAYFQRLQRTLLGVLGEFDLRARITSHGTNVWVGERPIACLGISIRNWVTYYGAVLNLNPILDMFKLVRTGKDDPPMTSLQRECRRPIRPSLVRELFLEHFTAQFGFGQTLLFTEHPMLRRKTIPHAITATG